jgi:hypothetical protein
MPAEGGYDDDFREGGGNFGGEPARSAPAAHSRAGPRKPLDDLDDDIPF